MTLISYQQWFDTGRTRRELERGLATGDLQRVRRGFVTDATEPLKPSQQHLVRLRATAPYLGRQTYFSRYSAAALHGLPLFARRYAEVTVARAGGGHGSIASTVHARRARLGESEVTEIDGLPVTSLARTVADLVRELPFAEAVTLTDAALASGVDRSILFALTDTGRGCRRAAAAIVFADGDSESPGESLSRVRMFQAGLVMPTLQHVVLDQAGRFLGRGDFYWEHKDVIGEFDGESKYGELAVGRTAAQVLMAEKRRQGRIEDTDTRVVRWTWPDIFDDTMVRRLTRVVGTAS
ncbi:MAG TPA: hypothetical protein PKV13_07460 [Propionicimonas sp.]|nr:hypothetical protein [Propionicimonas sp.]HRA06441.1 hypothetical protein [Propionicimonas sp.]